MQLIRSLFELTVAPPKVLKLLPLLELDGGNWLSTGCSASEGLAVVSDNEGMTSSANML